MVSDLSATLPWRREVCMKVDECLIRFPDGIGFPIFP